MYCIPRPRLALCTAVCTAMPCHNKAFAASCCSFYCWMTMHHHFADHMQPSPLHASTTAACGGCQARLASHASKPHFASPMHVAHTDMCYVHRRHASSRQGPHRRRCQLQPGSGWQPQPPGHCCGRCPALQCRAVPGNICRSHSPHLPQQPQALGFQ